MVRQIHHCVFVGSGEILNPQLVFLRQQVSYSCLQISGIAFLSIFTHVVQLQTHAVPAVNCPRLPSHLVEPSDSSVQVILSIVLGQRID